ncbi:MAG: hypothetical protein JKY15_04050 [Deltaproteobacteria bacterium]|nr:hypothetical protein [Deltaproteobacteria bacterium]
MSRSHDCHPALDAGSSRKKIIVLVVNWIPGQARDDRQEGLDYEFEY